MDNHSKDSKTESSNDSISRESAKSKFDATRQKLGALTEKAKQHDFKSYAHNIAESAKALKESLGKHDFYAEIKAAFTEAKKSTASIWKKPETLRPGKELAIVGLIAAVVLFLLSTFISGAFFGLVFLVLSIAALLISLLGLKTEGRKLAIGGSVVSILVVIGSIGLMIGGCGGFEANSESNLVYTLREKALQNYLEIQRAVSNGDSKTFEKFLGPDLQRIAKATPNGLQMLFGQLVSDNGAKLAKVFNDNTYFMLNDYLSEYDTHPKIQEKIYFLPKSGNARLVFPTPKQMKEIEEYRILFSQIEEAMRSNASQSKLGKKISNYLAKRIKEMFIAEEMSNDDIKEIRSILKGNNFEAKVRLLDNYGRFLGEKTDICNMPKKLAEKLHKKYPQQYPFINYVAADDGWEVRKVTFPFVITIDIKGGATFRGNPEAFKGPLVFDGEINGNELYGEIWLGRSDDGKWGMLRQ